LGQEREDLGHGEDFDEREKLGGKMREAARVKPAGADFCKEVCAQHFAAINKIDRAGNMPGVAILGLDCCELLGEFGREDEREGFRGFVAYGLLDKVCECHGMATASAVMRLDTRVSRRARLRDSPME